MTVCGGGGGGRTTIIPVQQASDSTAVVTVSRPRHAQQPMALRKHLLNRQQVSFKVSIQELLLLRNWWGISASQAGRVDL